MDIFFGRGFDGHHRVKSDSSNGSELGIGRTVQWDLDSPFINLHDYTRHACA